MPVLRSARRATARCAPGFPSRTSFHANSLHFHGAKWGIGQQQLRETCRIDARRPPRYRSRRRRRMQDVKEKVALSSIAVSSGMTVAKAVVGLMSGSLALLSEAAHSLIDVGATVMTYFAVRISGK